MQQSEVENNKRIAKNTLFLYLRMLLTLIVGLYTSRVVLQVLGVNDYGIYNVVGGLIGLLAYANNLLGQGTGRFITIGLAKGDIGRLNNIFNSCLTIHFVIAVCTLLVGELIGPWFINNYMNIEAGRLSAAHWVFQLSLVCGVISFMQAPYTATIIAHEKMSIYAYMSIYDVGMKLIIVLLLQFVEFDKLKLYSLLYFVVNLTSLLIYRIYCRMNFAECKFKLHLDFTLFKEIFNYVGWNSIGTFAFMANSQGINVLLNIFFSTAINAARGIAFTVSGIINQFVQNFQMAINPQVLKYYGTDDSEKMNRLVKNNAQFSSYLVMLFALPTFWETDFLIQLWLGQIPEYVIIFIRFTLIQIFIQAIDSPIGGGIHAYGKMKLPNITTSFIYLSVIPISYIAMKLGANPTVTYIVIVSVYPFALACDLWILNKYSQFNVPVYLRDVVLKGLIFIFVASVIPWILTCYMHEGFFRFLLSSLSSTIILFGLIYNMGLDYAVREQLKGYIEKRINISQK